MGDVRLTDELLDYLGDRYNQELEDAEVNGIAIGYSFDYYIWQYLEGLKK